MTIVVACLTQFSYAQDESDPPRPPMGPRASLRFDSVPPYELVKAKQLPTEISPDVWIRALRQGDRSLVSHAAEAFITAKRYDLLGIPENIGEILAEVFEQTEDRISRESLATALVAFDYRPSLPVLAAAVGQQDYRLDRIVEPALARWQHSEVIERNLKRVKDPQTPALWMSHAIDVLGNAEEGAAAQVLMEIVFDRRARGDHRLLAAKALAKIDDQQLIDEASQLVDRDISSDPLAGLLAVTILDRHRNQETVPVLKTLLTKGRPTLQANALTILQKIDHQLVLEETDRLKFGVTHPHSGLRQTVIESSYVAGDLPAINRLAPFLDDHHPENRQLAADALFDLAGKQDDFRAAVRDHVSDGLASDSWRVLEQSNLLAAGLAMNQTAPRMAELLSHPRTEVAVSAGYALKTFASDKFLDAALDQVLVNLEQQFNQSQPRELRDYNNVTEQTQHLFEYFADLNYQKAVPVLNRLIPKRDPGGDVIGDPRTRGIAIWTLGHLFKDNPDEQLVRQLLGRINDIHSPNPEQEPVRQACAYAFGWMRAEEAIPSLREFASRYSEYRSTSTACAWALTYLTGEEIPLSGDIEYQKDYKWFLMPIRSSDE